MRYRRIVQIALVMLVIILSGVASAQDNTYVIGDLILVGDVGFKAEMTQMGYIEGQNITYLYMTSDPNMVFGSEEWLKDYERQAKEMAKTVDVFVTNTDSEAVYLQTLVGDIPIVFARSDDPVATGAVKDLVTPGMSMTGIITNRPHERKLQLLTEVKPATRKVYYIYSTLTGEAEIVLQQTRDVGARLGVEVVAAPITDQASLLQVVQNVPKDVDWIFMTPYAFFDPDSFNQLLAVTQPLGIGIAGPTDIPTKGYTLGYGPDMDETGKQAAQIVDRILRGASPADLAIQTAENFLAVNLEATDAIGMDIPTSILRQAHVIARPGYWDNRDAYGNLITPTAPGETGN